MKIILINPPISKLHDPAPIEVLMENDDSMPPLGLLYLAGYLEKYTNYQIETLDCQIEGIEHGELKELIEKKNPDIVGVTTMTFTLPDVVKTIKIIKQAKPNAKIVLGGPHVHIYPEETIQIKEVDYCVLGEGEKPFKELLENIEDTENLYKVKGIVFKDKKKIINTGSPPPIQNLDILPFPARYLVPYKKYKSVLAKKFPVTTMITSRGCPFKCLFCDRPHMGNIFRARSAKNVVDEMEECKKMGIKEIFIYDDTFSVDRQRVLDICSEIIKRKLDIAWDVRTRVNTVDEKMLKSMKKAGCQRIHYGVEAGTEKTLKVLRKGITLDQVRKAFGWTKKAKIQTLAYFIIGSPGETKEDIMQTIKLAKKLKPDYATFSILTPYPATDLYKMGLEQGILPYDYWKEFAKNPKSDFRPYLHFWKENLSTEDLFKLLKKAYKSFYLSPNYVIKKILQLKSIKELLVKAKAAFDILKI